MAAYADAYLTDGSPLAADAVTLSPYLGVGALEPAFEAAEKSGRGVFVLALTSNPEAPAVQRAVNGGRSIAQTVVDAAAERNASASPIGGIGLVVGATISDLGVDLGALNGPVLAPGFGEQGATLSDMRTLFGKSLRSVLPATSRAVLRAGPEVFALRRRHCAPVTRSCRPSVTTDVPRVIPPGMATHVVLGYPRSVRSPAPDPETPTPRRKSWPFPS
ncbi:orotidine-5'-phosphate decarboxylase [Kibdelosporangium lantanae]|uniref:Orotidine-5'-phosphate decarboxylase n=1 Tax=Kibdelosporangium lantanae TaxID=1497396 RepID=A0ABW3MJF6_9PSEU